MSLLNGGGGGGGGAGGKGQISLSRHVLLFNISTTQQFYKMPIHFWKAFHNIYLLTHST